MRKKMREWMASQLSSRSEFVEEKITALLDVGLLSEKDAAEIRKGTKDPAKPTIGPTKWMYWNVHLDGLERTHDLIVEREGVFKECILAIKMAKLLDYQVATNATIYKETDMQEIEQMFDYLSDLGVDGHTITPGYDYDAAKKDMGNAKILRSAGANAGLDVFGGTNAPYIWVKTPNGLTSWQMFDRMLRELNVVITPGAGFGAQGEGYVRISAFNSRQNAEEVACRLKKL